MKGPLIEQIETAGAVSGDVPTFDAVLNRMGFKQPLALLTTKGDIIARTSSAPARVGIGADGTILQADTASTPGLKWALPPEQVLYDVKGDILIGSANDARNRLGVGSDGQVLTADSAQTLGVKWASPVGSLATDTLWDAKGDLVAGTGADTAAKVSVGTNGYVLIADSTQTAGVKWGVAPGAGSLADPTTTKGDLLVRDSTSVGRMAVGSDGKVLVADSTQSVGLKWAAMYQLGSADVPPASPNAKDDEFDGSSSVTWLNGPTALTTFDRNTTRLHHAYLRSNGNGANVAAVYQATPATPFTIVAKITGAGHHGNNNYASLFLSVASPIASSRLYIFGPDAPAAATTQVDRQIWTKWDTTGFSTASGVTFANLRGPWYLKIVVTSTTSVACYVSTDGFAWVPVETGFNPGFTIGSMGMSLVEGSVADMAAYFDFFRVT